MKRGLLLIDRGSKEREASEELETICKEVKKKGGYAFAEYEKEEIAQFAFIVAVLFTPQELDVAGEAVANRRNAQVSVHSTGIGQKG